MQPAVKKHGAVACAEDEAITVDPSALIGIEVHGVTVKHCSEFSASQGKSEVATGALVHGIHGQATSLIGSAREIRNRKGLRHFDRNLFDAVAGGVF